MAGEEAEHGPEREGGGRFPARGASDGKEASTNGSEPAQAAAADSTPGPAARPAAEPRDDYPGSGLPAGDADDPDAAAATLKAESLEFWIAADITYGRARASWLMLMHRLMLFGAVVGGTTAATDLAKSSLWAFGAAACAALDLVFDPATGAAEHRNNTRALHDALIQLKRAGTDRAGLEEVEIELLKLSAAETAPYNALRMMAHNAVTKGLGRDPAGLEYVRWERRWLANVIRFEGWTDARRDRWKWFVSWLLLRPYPES